jgi:hypothetical protein
LRTTSPSSRAFLSCSQQIDLGKPQTTVGRSVCTALPPTFSVNHTLLHYHGCMKQRVGDLFPRKWVNGQSLPGPLLVQLGEVEAATVHPRPGVEERAHVLRFEPIDHVTRKTIPLPGHERTPAGYGLVLTRRLAEQIAAAVGTDVLDDWKGRLVVFEPTTLNGKRVLTARKPKMASQDSAPSALDAEG